MTSVVSKSSENFFLQQQQSKSKVDNTPITGKLVNYHHSVKNGCIKAKTRQTKEIILHGGERENP